ncbi:SURF1 family protein [Brevibacterium daeguense]|uniref:SURF1-like protein n=1 Tax=Brevibacterium daeguense TaxID=909936 RepID=A0ABP8ENC6_9MICO|nr:SURF1 family protein [Brevibacterium daeguense]
MAGGGYRFIFSARWLRYIALAILATAVCLLLADWQDRRRAQRNAEIERIETNYYGDVQPLDSVLDSPTDELDADSEWTRVSMTGSYDEDATVLARNRTQRDQAGFYVVVPFVTDSGATIAVARGWIPTSDTGTVPGASAIPSPPPGRTTVEMWLRPKQDGSGDDNPPGLIRAIDPAVIPGMEQPFTEVYGQLAAEDPEAAEEITAILPPSTDPGSHLSYTFQWIVFGIMILGGVVYAARREKKAYDAQAAREQGTRPEPVEYVVVDKDVLKQGGKTAARTGSTASRYGTGPTARPSRRRKPTEEELEDSLLDAQGW